MTETKSPIRLLLLEDNDGDAELTCHALESDGLALQVNQVKSEAAFRSALKEKACDLILSDYSLPGYDGMAALRLARELQPEIPFLFFSGTIGEERAVESMKNGATDYVLKDRVERLPRAVRRALQEVQERRQRQRADQELRLLQTMTLAVSQSQDLHEAFTVVLREICERTGWMLGQAWIPRPCTDELQCSSAWYARGNGAQTFRAASENLVLRTGEGLPGRVYATKAPLWIRDVQQDANFPRAAAAQSAGLGAALAAPAMTGREVVAVLEFFTDKAGEADEGRVNMIAAVAAQLGSLIQHKRAEEQIQEQAALLDKAQDAILVRDLENRVIYWNKGAEEMYGWTAAEVTGRNANELFYQNPDQPAGIREKVLQEEEWMGELRQITKAGAELVVQSRWTLVRDAAGKPRSILIINTDITEKKKLEAQFLRTQRMESIGTLAGGIAHDLNNILSPILMSVRVLRDQKNDPVSRKILDILETSAQHGSSLVKQVLSFARGVEGEKTILQPKHLIADIHKMAKDTFPRSIQIEMKVAKDLWTIMGDATQLYQVLMNLCVNARDAMPDGGHLRLEAENVMMDEHFARLQKDARSGPYVVLHVMDTGTGIPPDRLERIFEPFYTTKEMGKGTGLGLSTALGIIKSHGGFMRVYSEPGKGTKFDISLPAVRTSETEKAEREQPPLPSGNGELILVVDDEFLISDMTKVTLEQYNYRVITAHDGTEALAQFVRNSGDIKLVMTDMMMPYMDGPATIRALRRLDPEVKVVAMSGLMESNKLSEIDEVGVRSFLQKPFTTEKLLTTVHQELARAPG